MMEQLATVPMTSESKIKILVVDDDISTVRIMTGMLIKNHDYDILTAPNGRVACEIALTEIPDLIIMDWEMPEMNGIEATVKIKENEATKDIPIIIATGVMIDSSNLSTALFTGAVDYIRKPIDETELLARVFGMLRLSTAYLKIKEQSRIFQEQLALKLIDIQQHEGLKDEVLKRIYAIKEQNLTNEHIQSITLEIENLIKSKVYEIDWNCFELHFEYLYPRFFYKLKRIREDLTQYDLQICAFIKLNMNSKEISKITYTSDNTINVARKRLKKKLGLTPEESLQSFIQNL